MNDTQKETRQTVEEKISITGIKGNNLVLACMKSFNRIWEKFYPKELPIVKTGNLEFIIDPKIKASTIESNSETIVLRASNEQNLFKTSMVFLQHYVSGDIIKEKEILQENLPHKLLMLDIGRKHYPLESLKEFVDMLAFFNFDQLQLHFSENEGFRIASDNYPWLASKEHLTKSEIRELLQYARVRHIEIIPDLDTPGHLKHALANYPNWRLTKLNEQGQLEKDERALDILNPEAVAFVKSLYKEYGELFQECRYFHIGADEFVPFDNLHDYPTLASYATEKYGPTASGIEVLIEYVNDLMAFVKQLGFIPMVWNDGFYRVNRDEKIHLEKDCLVSYWTRWNKNMASVDTFLKAGYEVINHNDNYFYYVLGENASYTYPTYEKIMENWEPNYFPQQQVIAKEQLQQVYGNAIAVWADIPQAKTVHEVKEDVFYLLAALMEKADRQYLGDKKVIEKIAQQFF